MKKKGFTIIELIVAMAILGIVMSILGNIFNYGSLVTKEQEIQTDVQSDVQMAIMDLSDNIRLGTKFIDTPLLLSAPNGNVVAGSDYGRALRGLYISNNIVKVVKDISSDYTPIIYIEKVNGDKCLYACKSYTDNNGEAAYEFHRINFKKDTSLTFIEDTNNGRIDKLTSQYYYKYKFAYGTHTNTTDDFYYYQDNNYFHCKKDATDGNYYDTYQMIKQPYERVFSSDHTIASNLRSIVKADKLGNSYKIEINISVKSTRYSFEYPKKIISNVAIVSYGGDSDDK